MRLPSFTRKSCPILAKLAGKLPHTRPYRLCRKYPKRPGRRRIRIKEYNKRDARANVHAFFTHAPLQLTWSTGTLLIDHRKTDRTHHPNLRLQSGRREKPGKKPWDTEVRPGLSVLIRRNKALLGFPVIHSQSSLASSARIRSTLAIRVLRVPRILADGTT